MKIIIKKRCLRCGIIFVAAGINCVTCRAELNDEHLIKPPPLDHSSLEGEFKISL